MCMYTYISIYIYICATSAPAPLWVETSSPKLKQASWSTATTKLQASSDLGPPLGVFTVSYQRYEGDISITLCETCRSQTLCPVNMKYLQGREKVCVLNVWSMDLILSVTGVAVSTCFFYLYIPVVFILFHVSLLIHAFVC